MSNVGITSVYSKLTCIQAMEAIDAMRNTNKYSSSTK